MMFSRQIFGGGWLVLMVLVCGGFTAYGIYMVNKIASALTRIATALEQDKRQAPPAA